MGGAQAGKADRYFRRTQHALRRHLASFKNGRGRQRAISPAAAGWGLSGSLTGAHRASISSVRSTELAKDTLTCTDDTLQEDLAL